MNGIPQRRPGGDPDSSRDTFQDSRISQGHLLELSVFLSRSLPALNKIRLDCLRPSSARHHHHPLSHLNMPPHTRSQTHADKARTTHFIMPLKRSLLFPLLAAALAIAFQVHAIAPGPKANHLTPFIARGILLAGMEHEMDSVATADLALTKTEANTTCIATYCQEAALSCVKDKDCRAALSCLSSCDELEDNTPDKIELQKCTADCVVTYENDALDNVNACFDSHDCITLTPIPLTCRDTSMAAPALSNITLMEGKWWATYGKNAVYDCYPCQRLTFSPIDQTVWLYDSKYLTPTLDGGVRAYELQAAFPWPADGMASAIAFNYTYQGMSHGEEWRFLHVDPSVVILYYCGRGNTWNYEGGLVLSRERNSPPEHAAMAREVFGNIGIDFDSEFCTLQPNKPCPGF